MQFLYSTLIPLLGILMILIGLLVLTNERNITPKRFIEVLCYILPLSFVLFLLIILTIFTEDDELSIPFCTTITEIVKEIIYNHNYYIGGSFPDPVNNTAPSEAPSEGSNPSTVVPDPIPCPCCETAEGETCNCLGDNKDSGSHQLDPPFDGMDAEMRGDIDRICCRCGNAFDLRCCFACECVICNDCQTSSQPIRSDFAEPDNSPIGEKDNPDSFT